MKIVLPVERPLEDALALGPYLLKESADTAILAASVVRGPAIVLGAKQSAGRVVDLAARAAANVQVCRRTTTGTAVWIGGAAIVLTLVLPHVAVMVSDATARTLLNRNVRPFLRAFTRAGAMAHYFGREWISLKQQPFALLGYDVTRQGQVLMEVFVGTDEPVALPEDLKAAEERAVDRFMGKTPACMRDVFPHENGLDFAKRVVEHVAGEGASHFSDVDEGRLVMKRPQNVTRANDPAPDEFVLKNLSRVPIGYVETLVHRDEPTNLWLGGDVLAPAWVYEDLARGELAEPGLSVPIDGAKLEDLRRIVAGLS